MCSKLYFPFDDDGDDKDDGDSDDHYGDEYSDGNDDDVLSHHNASHLEDCPDVETVPY